MCFNLGECISNRADIKKIDVDIENYWSNSRWMNRVWEESAKGEGARIVTPGFYSSTTTVTSDVSDVSNNFGDQLDIPWLVSNQTSNETIKSTNSSSGQVSNVSSHEIVIPATTFVQSLTVPANNLQPTVSYDTSTMPWLILKSPSSQSPLETSTTLASPSTSDLPTTTTTPHQTSPSSTTVSPTEWTTELATSKISIHPVHLPNTTDTPLSSTTVRPSTTTKRSTTRLTTSTNKNTTSSTAVRVPTTTTPTSRPQTKRQTTRKSGPTVAKTTPVPKSPVVVNSNSKAAANGAQQPSVSNYDVDVVFAIDEAISYITAQLEELKKRSGNKPIKQQ